MSVSKNVIEGNEANFEREVLQSPIPVLVDFWAAWCGPCRMVAPAVEQIADEFAGQAKVVKVDVDANQALAMRFGITSIPTLAVFQGGTVVDSVIGAVSKNVLAEVLRKRLALA